MPIAWEPLAFGLSFLLAVAVGVWIALRRTVAKKDLAQDRAAGLQHDADAQKRRADNVAKQRDVVGLPANPDRIIDVLRSWAQREQRRMPTDDHDTGNDH